MKTYCFANRKTNVHTLQVHHTLIGVHTMKYIEKEEKLWKFHLIHFPLSLKGRQQDEGLIKTMKKGVQIV